MSARTFEAVILAGGSGDRLGGVDKAALRFRGVTLLDRSLHVVSDASRIVCVGPRRDTDPAVIWVREEPPGGGPVAALAAALPLLEASLVVVIACDLPFLQRSSVTELVASVQGDGAILVDDGGRGQYLAAAYRTEFLRARLSGSAGAGRSMRSVLVGASLVTVEGGASLRDIDTPEDLALLSHQPL